METTQSWEHSSVRQSNKKHSTPRDKSKKKRRSAGKSSGENPLNNVSRSSKFHAETTRPSAKSPLKSVPSSSKIHARRYNDSGSSAHLSRESYRDRPSETESQPSTHHSCDRRIVKDSSFTMQEEYLESSAPYAELSYGALSVFLTQFPSKIIDGIRVILEENWYKGIKKEKICHEQFTFIHHRRGWPTHQLAPSTIILRNILAYLAGQGWIAQACPSLHRTLNFRKSPQPLPQCYWLVVSLKDIGSDLSRSDEVLEIIGGADELLNTIRLSLKEMDLLSKSKRGAEWSNKEQSIHRFEFKKRVPWRRWRENGVKKTVLILRLLERLEERGWLLYCSSFDYFGKDVNLMQRTWYCVKSRDWTPENPVKLSWS